MKENDVVRQLLLKLYKDPDILDSIDDIACKHCTRKEECMAKDDGCDQTPEEAIDLFIEYGLSEGEKQMRLKDTVNLMTSDNYKDRLRAEYWQLKIRMDRLRKRAAKYVASDIRDESDSYALDVAMMDQQLDAMENYLKTLEVRAALKDIELEVEA